MIPRNPVAAAKVVVFAACLVPLAIVAAKIFGLASFGANPVEEVLFTMGKTGLNLLWITLAVTPVRKLTKLNWLVRLRRMLGLFAFFYLTLHLLTYIGLDRRFDWGSLIVDVTERPYITLGMLGIVLMIPLAVTSTKGWQRRLGRNWTRLHRLVYPIAILGAVHFWWQTKADIREPLVYAVILSLLLGYRLVDSRMRARRRAAAQRPAAP
ncbi:MAG TPA: protein-methionine-sulfoxide reductase heme-binding subunit MsrQ [Gammaproteobacteria bacterium]